MNVFEDLIDELKNENLLESTAAETSLDGSAPYAFAAKDVDAVAIGKALSGEVASVPDALANNSHLHLESPSAEDREFYCGRVEDELSSLQMVENVFCGIEQANSRSTPHSYDDLNAKKALHKLLQISSDAGSPDFVEAEFDLRQETQAWAVALHERDRSIRMAGLRRFCEDSRPILSSQALVALARFYRNSPFSEDVRAKFDFVMTRLFSRDSGENTRKPLFSEAETIGHIQTLYGKWSSIALYSASEDQHRVSAAIDLLDGIRLGMEKSASLDEFLGSEMFARVQRCKEDLAEVFFVPEVVSAAISRSMSFGNRFVELVTAESSKGYIENAEAKHGETYHELISDAAGKTLLIADVIAGMDAEEIADVPASKVPAPAIKKLKAIPSASVVRPPGMEILGVNPWLMALCLMCIAVGVGVYVWAEKFAAGGEAVQTISTPVRINDAELEKYIRSPRATRETLYAVTEPAFDALSDSEKRDLLAKVQRLGSSMNYPKVNFINSDGQSVAYASKDRLELIKK